MQIAFIGLGKMGAGMALNVAKAFPVTVYDASPDSVAAVTGDRVRGTTSAVEAAADADVLITMLPGPAEIEEVVATAADALKPDAVWIDMSSSSLDAMERVKSAFPKLTALDAPVTGGVPGALAGNLQIFVGGEANVLNVVRPVLETMGQKDRILHVGGQGAGYSVKLCINLGFFINAFAAAEVLTLGVKAGVDLDVLHEALTRSGATSAALENDLADNVFNGDYKEYFRLALALKDIRLAVDLGRKAGVPLEVSALVEQITSRALQMYGDGGQLLAIRQLEEAAGISLRT